MVQGISSNSKEGRKQGLKNLRVLALRSSRHSEELPKVSGAKMAKPPALMRTSHCFPFAIVLGHLGRITVISTRTFQTIMFWGKTSHFIKHHFHTIMDLVPGSPFSPLAPLGTQMSQHC